MFKPFDGFVERQIRGICTLVALAAVGLDHHRAVIGPLSYMHAVIIEAGRSASQMPFSNHGRLIAGLLQQLGKGRLRTVEHRLRTIVPESVPVAELSGKDHGPTRSAIAQQQPLPGDPVDIRRRVQSVTVGTDRLHRMIIRHDIDDIRSFGAAGWRLCRGRRCGRKHGNGCEKEFCCFHHSNMFQGFWRTWEKNHFRKSGSRKAVSQQLCFTPGYSE